MGTRLTWTRTPLLLLLLLTLSLGGCVTNASNCAGWQEIILSKQDRLTQLTETQILEHNRQGERQGCWSAPR